MGDGPVDFVAAARTGDHEAFAALVRATYNDVYALAWRLMGNEEDAGDVVQEVYLRAYRGIGRFRGDAQINTWLYRITANCAATSLGTRRRHRHDQLDDAIDPLDRAPDADPVDRALAADLRTSVEMALATLPPRLRAVVVLRDIYDLPHETIAAELGITETAAKVRLHRARRALRAQCFPDRRDQDRREDIDRAV
jgi:RNA polymerase sigma-70 factor (ECF subfamily)